MARSHVRGVFVLIVAFLTLAVASATVVSEGFESGFSEGDDPDGPYPYLTITDWENLPAKVVEEGFGFRSYTAGSVEDGCLDEEFGFGWNVDPVREPVTNAWTFEFDHPFWVNSFSIDLLDFGDYFKSGYSGPATVTMTAYNSSNGVVATDSLTTTGISNAYDACASGGAGVQNLGVASLDFNIAKVVISFSHIDQGIGFDNMAFETGLTEASDCAAGDFYAEAYAPGATPPTFETSPLVAGHQYEIGAYGTFFAGGSGVTDIRADAEYSQDRHQRLNGLGWTDEVRNYEVPYGESLLELLVGVGGAPEAVEWGSYTDSHAYSIIREGTGDPATFQFGIYDIFSSNNAGGICISLTMLNRAPAVDEAADDAFGDEGDVLMATGSFTDADGDGLTLSADNTRGLFMDHGDGSWTWVFATDDNYSGTVTVTAADGYGGSATDVFDYESVNVAPLVNPITGVPSGFLPVGSTVTLSATFSDPGTADTHVADWNWGDGTGPVTSPATSTKTYDVPGIYDETVILTITDDDGGETTVSTEFRVMIWDRMVSGGGQVIDEVGPKVKDDLKVSFGGYIYDLGVDGYLCEWEVNLHNVSGTQFDGAQYHTDYCTVFNTWPPRADGSPDPMADGVSNFTTWGSFNGEPGYKAIFRMEDYTEPGKADTIRIEIFKIGEGLVYDTYADWGSESHNVGTARALLDRGNIQVEVLD